MAHGIGVFDEMVTKDLSGIVREYLAIRYAEDDYLYVPIEEVYRVSKYVGKDNPTLTRLGKPQWQQALSSAKKEVEDIAHMLLENHAKRQVVIGFEHLPFVQQERDFEAAFGHVYTPDQESAIMDIRTDMEKSQPMERLLTGDVGF